MQLIDLKRKYNLYTTDCRNKKAMGSHCRFAYVKFFWHILPGEPWIDLAVWQLGSDFTLRPASSSIDESNKKFLAPPPIWTDLKEYRQAIQKLDRTKKLSAKEKLEEMSSIQAEMVAAAKPAILRGFEYKQVQTAFSKYNPKSRPFTIIATLDDQGIQASDFEVLWSNRKSMTTAKLKKQIAKSKGSPLPAGDREPSVKRVHLDKLKETEKKERAASKKFWAAEKSKAEGLKPKVRKQLLKKIEAAEKTASRKKTINKRTPKKKSTQTSVGSLVSLGDSVDPKRAFRPKVKLDAIVDNIVNHKWSNFDEYNNRMWQFTEQFLDPATKKIKARSVAQLWSALNRPQRLFYTVASFSGQTDNGGVWQFLFNKPELSLAALEVFHEIGATKLARDYQATLEEVVGNAKTVSGLRKKFVSKKLDDAQRWRAFAEGYEQASSASKIEKYFYTLKFKKQFYKQTCDFVEDSLSSFAQIKV
jgi:hypothetical protein